MTLENQNLNENQNISLLDPVSRIIQKIKVIDVNNIDSAKSKKANKVALKHFLRVRRCHKAVDRVESSREMSPEPSVTATRSF